MISVNKNIFIVIVGMTLSSTAMAESEPFFCRQAQGCDDCVLNGCSWAMGQCIDSCMQVADAKCYNLKPFPQVTAQQLCARIRADELDDQLCASQQGCYSCTAAIKSDGKPCQYYLDQNTKMGYCGSGGCDMMGNCPVQSCNALGDRNGQLPIPPPLPVNYNCGSRTSCSSCLAGGSTCAWSQGSCHDSCSANTVPADAGCFSLSTLPGSSGDEICEDVKAADRDQYICQVAKSCQACTNTRKADGQSRCSWYIDGANGWCGTGACDMNGNCGSNVCAVPYSHSNIRGGSN